MRAVVEIQQRSANRQSGRRNDGAEFRKKQTQRSAECAEIGRFENELIRLRATQAIAIIRHKDLATSSPRRADCPSRSPVVLVYDHFTALLRPPGRVCDSDRKKLRDSKIIRARSIGREA